MLIIRLKGGLGNQLFQLFLYSFLKTKTSVKIDNSFFTDQKNWIFKIYRRINKVAYRKQNIKLEDDCQVDREEILDIVFERKSLKKCLLRGFPISLLIRIFSSKRVKEDFCLDHLLTTNKNFIFDGFYQKIDYATNEETQSILIHIRNLLNNSGFLKDNRLSNKNTIHLHVRRGDYLNHKEYIKLEVKFYVQAIERLWNANNDICTIVLISDDIEWCKYNFKSLEGRFEFQYKNGTIVDDFNELYFSKNLIIGNSTFSYWAAFLSEKVNTVYPKRWYTDQNTELYFPNFWIGI